MAAEVDTAEEIEDAVEGEEAPPKSKKMLFIIGGAVLVLLLGAGAGAYFFLFAGGDDASAAKVEVVPTFFYDLDTMTVNLNSDDDQFLKLSIALELENEEMVAIVQPRMARVVDAFQVYLRELRPADLEGSAGIYRLKEELRRRVNLAIAPAEVRSILFKEILVQ